MVITARRLSIRLLGVSLMILAMGCAIALLTHDANDPSWNNASAEQIRNALGAWGATTADILFQSIGITSVIAIVPPLLWGLWLVDGRVRLRLPSRMVCWFLSIVALATSAGLLPAKLFADQAAATGGAIGDALFRTISSSIASIGIPTPEVLTGMLAGVSGSMLMAWAIGLNPFQVTMPAIPLRSGLEALSGFLVGLKDRLTSYLQGYGASERVEPRIAILSEPDPS